MIQKEQIEETIANFKDAQKSIVDAIFKSDMTKLEKLKMLSEKDLLGYNGYICHVFIQSPLLKQRIADTFANDRMLDDIDPEYTPRYSSVDLYQRYLSDLEYEEFPLTVISCRGSKEIIDVTQEELIDIIYDWVETNRQIGFEVDW